MSCKSILGIAASACVPALAFAGSGFVLNDDTTLHLTGVGQVRFEDNVLLTKHNTKSDTIFSIIPGAELDYNGGQSKGVVTLSEDFERYASNGHMDAELFSGIGELKYDSGMTKIDSRIGYRQMNQGSSSARNADQTVRHDLFDASVNGNWSATAKTSIGSGIMYDRTNYAGAGYADNEHFSLPLDVYYSVSPKVDVSFGYRYRSTKIEELPAVPVNYDSNDHFFNVGARGEFTPKLKGQFRVGYGIRDFDHQDTTDQLGLSGGLTYVYSPKTSFDFSVSNDFDNSVVGTSQEVFAVRTGGKFAFTPQWSAQAGLSFESTKYANSTRTDDFFVGDAAVAYAMNESVSIQGAYSYRTSSNSKTYSVYDFNSNLLSLGISLRY
jgi:hypothetical protein